ncbi:MAG: hypothetical protein ABI831_10545 [Betaproteobacteria bacterium]
MTVREAATRLAAHNAASPSRAGEGDAIDEARRGAAGNEARFVVPGFGDMPVLAIDSVSLCRAGERDAVVITGSHGGLLGGRPLSAINTDVYAALFNDADVGIDVAGIGRLGPLNDRGIAGITVSAWSARIGDARSTLEDGIVSFVNGRAHALGARPGQTARELLARLAEHWPQRNSNSKGKDQ